MPQDAHGGTVPLRNLGGLIEHEMVYGQNNNVIYSLERAGRMVNSHVKKQGKGGFPQAD